MRDRAEPIPGRYSAAIAVMETMHWSWSDLCNAPADLVEEILHRMERTTHWRKERERLEASKRKAQEGKHGR